MSTRTTDLDDIVTDVMGPFYFADNNDFLGGNPDEWFVFRSDTGDVTYGSGLGPMTKAEAEKLATTMNLKMKDADK